jgi:uncharacterized membrane protein (UPF0127 family)
MHATVLPLVAVLCLACTRTEEPQSAHAREISGASTAAKPAPTPAAASVSTAAPDIRATSSASPPCVVPMAEQPLPQQKPAASCPKDAGPPHTFASGNVSFSAGKPSAKVEVERARLPSEHQRGLMYRTEMAEGRGMLFEWPEESRRVFWMRNTCIPLDMLFLSKDGTVAGILEQVPVLNDEPRTVPCNASYVLEVNAGWCRRHGVKPGMRATIL